VRHANVVAFDLVLHRTHANGPAQRPVGPKVPRSLAQAAMARLGPTIAARARVTLWHLDGMVPQGKEPARPHRLRRPNY
jgi:hypothetical protein